MSIEGGCLCGKIRYQIAAPLESAEHCHCSMCRRFHGAAFSSYADFNPDDFHWLQGEDQLGIYEPNPGKGWAFCKTCGSSLGMPGADGRLTSVALGTVDGDPGIRPTEHMFVGSKAVWYDITDDLPQHKTRSNT
ncbi:GFA family protein [Saccharospirillum sp. HFRX-1]|uniref:GFA family protein n=1 Tax=unclassified Saccharospirillum TaxID=2633430 RepID=UPI00372409AF